MNLKSQKKLQKKKYKHKVFSLHYFPLLLKSFTESKKNDSSKMNCFTHRKSQYQCKHDTKTLFKSVFIS